MQIQRSRPSLACVVPEAGGINEPPVIPGERKALEMTAIKAFCAEINAARWGEAADEREGVADGRLIEWPPPRACWSSQAARSSPRRVRDWQITSEQTNLAV